MIKLTIVIPIYNVENFLEKCIKSVLYPELEGYEIILVNDGSTDSSPAIAARFAEEYPQLITLVSTPNGGLGHARNEGIDAAKGEYLLFLDSDDYLTENAVPEILETVSGGADMYIYDFVAVNEQEYEFKYFRGYETEGRISLETHPDLVYAANSAVNKICRRSVYTDNAIRFPDRVWYEDLCTVPKLYLCTSDIVCLHKVWYHYFQRSGSITNSAQLERNLEIIPAVGTVVDFYKEKGEFEHYKTELDFLAFYHQFLTACTRVAQADPRSPVLDTLREDFLAKYPDFEQNERYRAMPKKWLLLSKLIARRRYSAVAAIMKLNNIVRKK